MARIVSIKFNHEEAEALQRAYAASGTSGLSSHIKQVYFDALRPPTDALQGIRRELELIAASLGRLQQEGAEGDEPQLVLSLLCGTYLMVRKSVGESVRSQADQLLDVSAIEGYLKGR